MKNRNVLSGVAALLLVGTFYSFAFCMVEDVDEEMIIPMDYYYSTETDADTGERLGGVTSAFDAKEMPKEISEILEKRENKVVTVPPAKDASSGEVPALPFYSTEKQEDDTPAPAENNAARDELPRYYAEVNIDDDDLEEDGGGDYDLPEDTDTDSSGENDNADADNKSVFADNNAVDRFLSSSDANVPVVTEIPDEPDSDTNVLTLTLPDIPPVPASEIVITVNVDAPPAEEKTVQPETPKAPSSSETLTARYEGSVHTVNAFDLVCMIVNREISTSFKDEAIKAQAVAAYSYVKYHNVNGLTPSVVVKSDPPQRIKDLVASVWGKCCYYNGSVAQTVYTASSAGYSASSENVWGGKVGYLVSVPCPFDVSDPNYGIQVKFSEKTIRSALESYLGITLSENPSKWLQITDYCDGNYVSQINVDGQKTISGRKLRENVLNFQLKSASFDVNYRDGYFIFTTYGYGHGVGMSQNGANILAGMGYSWDDILKFYFTGIDII